MTAIASLPKEPAPADPSAIVAQHRSFRGLKVEQNLLAQFTMYVVDLDQYGLFISDSRPEAFSMALEALSNAGRMTRPA